MKLGIIALAAVGSLGCVSQGKYDRAVTDYNQAVARYDQAVAKTHTTSAELARKDLILEQTNADLLERGREVDRLKAEIELLDRSRSGDNAANKSRISDLQKRLGELEAAQRASEARAALYKDLSFKLKKQIDDGNLAIVIRDGRMVLQLPNDVLFDTGRTELKPAGKTALRAVAEVIRAMPTRQFQVAGHTDNVPIHNDHFTSNWELSAGRALGVVHFLIGEGANATSLSAAGYSEVDPVSSNDTADGRKRNRRTEITLQPNIDELVRLP
jgi:chemotaxis protein MotB